MRATLDYLWQKKVLRTRPTLAIRPRSALYPLVIRVDSTDPYVFREIFVQGNYGPLRYLRDVGLILDCGANVGYTAAYLMSVHPHARVIAVEPDPGNFAILERNLAPYGTRARCLNAAVWSRSAGLVMNDKAYRGGGEWARQVRECEPGEVPDVSAVDIPHLLALSGDRRISLLKIDIEGAEALVFAADDVKFWLPRVDTIAIELHDDAGFGSASEIFASAIAGQDFVMTTTADMLICTRPGAPPSR